MKHSLDLLNWKNLPKPLPPWFLPQALSWINRTVTLVPGNNGWSFKQTLIQLVQESKKSQLWCETKQVDPQDLQGLWNTLCSSPRGVILPRNPSQTSTEGMPYSAGVPLILSSFKTFRGADYESWDWTEGEENWSHWLDPDLVEFRKFHNFEVPWSDQELLELRVLGTTYKSGPHQGTTRRPDQAVTISSTGVVEFDVLPRLVKLALTRSWIWNKTHRLVVGSVSNWDHHQNLTTSSVI